MPDLPTEPQVTMVSPAESPALGGPLRLGASESPLQWTVQASGTTEPLLGVWGTLAAGGPGISPGADVFAVGYNGTILRWNGNAWSAMTASTGASFFGVWGSSSNDVFAVGSGGTIERWNGTAWSAMTSNTTESFWGVWGSASNDVFAVGSNGTIQHWNGTAWSAMTSGTTEQLYRVWGSSSSDVFVTGANGLILHWNGTAWSTMTSGTTATLLGIWGTASNDVYAVGAGGTILHWNGATWSAMTSGVTDWLYGVWGNTRAMYAVSDGGKVLEYYGGTWTTLATGTDGIFFEGIWGASERSLFLIGIAGEIVHGRSKAVASVTVSPGSATLYEVGQTQAFTAVARDGDGLVIPDAPITWSSSNYSVATVSSAGVATLIGYGAATITATSGPHSGSATLAATFPDVPLSWTYTEITRTRSIWGSSINDVWAVGDQGQIHRYDGSTWARVESGTTRDLYAVRGGSRLLVAGDQVVLIYSVGDGAFYTAPSIPSAPYSSAVFRDILPMPVDQRVFMTQAGVGLWQADISDLGNWVWTLAISEIQLYGIGSDENSLGFPIWVASSGTLVRSDGGPFSYVYEPGTPGNTADIWQAPGGDVWAAGSWIGLSGTSWHGISRRVGSSWSAVPFSIPAGVTSIRFYGVHGTSADNIYFVGSPNLIFHWDGTTLSQLPSPSSSPDHVIFTVWVAPTGEVFIGSSQGIWMGTPILGAPSAPSGLTATASSSQIDLSWTDNANNEARFEVERRAQSGGVFGSWALLTEPAANATSYTDATAAPGVPTEYRVRSCNYAGCSAWSNVASGIRETLVPLVPTGLNASYASGQITLSWTDNATDETRVQVWRQVDPGTGTLGAWSILANTAADATSYVDTDVTTGYRYGYVVQACHEGGCSPWSSGRVIRALSVPSVPTGLDGSYASGEIALSWTDNASNESRVQVWRQVDPGTGTLGTWSVLANTAADATGYVDTDVTGGYRYGYVVQACNDVGCSPWSSGRVVRAVAVPTVPSVPTGLDGSYGSGEITLSWTDNAANETRVQVWRQVDPGTGTLGTWSILANTAADATGYVDTDVTGGYRYGYVVQACNDVGCSPWSSGRVVRTTAPPPVPSVPTDLTAAFTPWQITLNWTDNASNETRVQVWRQVDPGTGTLGAWSILTNTTADATSYVDTDVTSGYRYGYVVQACNATGCSPWSSGRIARALSAPSVPTGLGATYASGQVTLDWTDNASDETRVQIWRQVDPGTGTLGTWSILANTAADAISHVDTDVTSGYRYGYVVQACNDAGCSPWSSGRIVRALSVPAVPTGLDGAYAAGLITLTWADNATNETRVQVWRQVDPGTGTLGSWSIVDSIPADATTYVDTDVTSGYRYGYVVQACNDAGCSPWSSGRVIRAMSVPPVPTGLDASYAAGQITLTWTDNAPNETRVQIWRLVDPGTGTFGSWAILANVPQDITTFFDTDVTSGFRYGYVVQACNEVGCSPWSAGRVIRAEDPSPAPLRP